MMFPRVSYGVGPIIVEPNAPLGLWESGFLQHGGARRATSGSGTGYTQRTDYIVDLIFRCRESEIPAVSAWLEWATDLSTFTFRFDKTDVASQYTTRLLSPAKNEQFKFNRSRQYPNLQELRVTLMSSTRFTYSFT